MFDLVTPLQDIRHLQLDARFTIECKEYRSALKALDEIGKICDETLTELNRLALLTAAGKEAKI